MCATSPMVWIPYTAQQADAVAKRRYAEARNKPQMQKEAMAALDALVTPLIKKGQPLTHIYAEHGAELPVACLPT